MIGRIHSLETIGLVDGPGIRTVVFLQGCSLRCAYCHNPDTWECRKGQEIEAKELLQKLVRYKPYFAKSGGGVTFSGGEPLLQPEFLLEMLKLCKTEGIHTTLDTAGFGRGEYDEILQYTDLVILDIKHVTPQGYLSLTKGRMEELFRFKTALDKANKKLWLRHVVVPGITDGLAHMCDFKNIISSFKEVEKVELIPYHTLGVNKYKEMGLAYALEGVEPMNKKKLKKLERYISSSSLHLEEEKEDYREEKYA